MNNLVNIQIVLCPKSLLTHLTDECLDSCVQFLVLHQILLIQKRFIALITAVRSWPLGMNLHVRLKRVFRSEVLAARGALVRPFTSVHIHVFVEKILGTVLFMAFWAFMLLRRCVMKSLMNSELPEIEEDSHTMFTVEFAFSFRAMELVHMVGGFTALVESFITNVADVIFVVVGRFQVTSE